MRPRVRTLVAATLAGLACTTATGARELRGDGSGDPMNRVELQAARSRDVANDWIRAVVGVTAEDPDAAKLADRINRTMTWALGIARARSGIEVRSGGYRTSPITDQGKLRRWRATQDLILEGGEAEVMSALIGELQSRMQLRSMGFTVSRERRQEIEDELIKAALAAFQARAALVTRSLGKSGYEIVRISVAGGGGVPVRPMFAEAAMAGARSVAPPAFEVGSSELTVRVSGTVELY